MSLEEEERPVFNWVENVSHLCYSEEGDGSHGWCGWKDECSGKGMVLPLFFEETWPWQLRAFIYCFALLYR